MLQMGIKVKHYCGIVSLHGVHECKDEWVYNIMRLAGTSGKRMKTLMTHFIHFSPLAE